MDKYTHVQPFSVFMLLAVCTQWSDFNDHGHLNDNFAIFGLLFIPRNSHLNYLAGSKGHF
jgi:hypothetical protein